MSSEAAYFPDALARPGEVREVACDVPEISTELPGKTSDEPAEAAVQGFEASDEKLLEQVRDGEREALALLFRRHARAVRNVAIRILRDEAEADDLVQEVFLFIFRKAALFDADTRKGLQLDHSRGLSSGLRPTPLPQLPPLLYEQGTGGQGIAPGRSQERVLLP